MSKRNQASAGALALLLLAALVAASLALSLGAIGNQAGQQDGEWVAGTPTAQQHSNVCTPNGCVEWCKYTEAGLQPSGQLCCSDAEGRCIQGTIFYP